MKNLEDLTIVEAINGLKEKEFTSLELVQFYLARIKQFSKLNAYITVCEEEAIKQAKLADSVIANGEWKVEDKPLLGIPIAVKDNFLTSGIKTTAASKVLENYIPVYDATVVSRLKKAGAIILGKTNHDAWAHGSSGENSDFGPTLNPYNQEYVPGGSSSGSAAALAASLCLASTGTDTGGSIRLPASFCNLVGLKPTYGRVSRYGVIAMASSLDAIGHFTKNIEDSAYLLQITAGQDQKDATVPEKEVPNYLEHLKDGVKGLKIGIPKEYFVEGMDPKVREVVETAIMKLKDQGAEIVEISLPNTKYAIAAYYLIQTSEVSSNLARYDGIRFGNNRQSFGDEAKRRIMLGTYSLSSGYYDQYYAKAQKVRTLIKEDFEKAFNICDAILAPVSPTIPFKLGSKTDDPLEMYLSDVLTVTANLAGIPALAMPAGFAINLPVGIQFLGPQFAEDKLFRLGYAFESVTNYSKIKPKLC